MALITVINHVTHMCTILQFTSACIKGSLGQILFKCSSWFTDSRDLCDLVVMNSTSFARDALIFAGKNLAKQTEFFFHLSRIQQIKLPVIRALPFQISAPC